MAIDSITTCLTTAGIVKYQRVLHWSLFVAAFVWHQRKFTPQASIVALVNLVSKKADGIFNFFWIPHWSQEALLHKEKLGT